MRRHSQHDRTEIDAVARGYDIAGDEYFRYYRSEPSPIVQKYQARFINGVASGGDVLELGCGNGLPLTADLASVFNVTAVDISSGQLEKARANVPSAAFVQADMSTLEMSPGSFDGVIAFYSIIHLPASLQAKLMKSIYSWLRPGGLFVATFNSKPGNHQEDDWFGAPMSWSGLGADGSREIVADAGFLIESDIVETSDDPQAPEDKEIHLWIVARKPQ